MDEVQKSVERLNTESIETKRRLDILEENDKRHDQDIRELHKHHEGTKVYVTQILGEIKELKSQLFVALTNSQTSGHIERKDWQNLLRDVLKMTLGAIVAYLFVKGG